MAEDTIATRPPPVAHVEIVSPAHDPYPTFRQRASAPEKKIAIEHTTHGPLYSLEYNHPLSSLEFLAYDNWRVTNAEFDLCFRYRRHSGEEITNESWMSSPEKLEFLDDYNDHGRCIRIYVFFSRRAAASGDRTESRYRRSTAQPWWSHYVWSTVPLNLWKYERMGKAFPGANSQWIAATGARPPWLTAHARPPLTTVRPPAPQTSAPECQASLMSLAPEVRVRIFYFLLNFDGLRRSIKRGAWSLDRYLRQTPPILLVSKTVSAEAQDALYKQPLALDRGINAGSSNTWSPAVRDITHLISRSLVRNLWFINLRYADPYGQGLYEFLRMAINVADMLRDVGEPGVSQGRRPASRVLAIDVPGDVTAAVRSAMVDNTRLAWGLVESVLETGWKLARKCDTLPAAAAEPLRVELGRGIMELRALYEGRSEGR